MARKNNVSALAAADGSDVPAQLIVGVSLQLTAVPTYEDGTTGTPTTDAEWALTPAGNGVIPKGDLTLSKPGAATVTATLANADGSKVTSDPVTVTGVNPPAGTILYSGLSDVNTPATFTEAYVKALTANTPGDGEKTIDIDFTPDASHNKGLGQYDVIALPASLTGVKFATGGFEMPMTKTSTVSLDNVSFDMWVSDNMLTKAHAITVTWK